MSILDVFRFFGRSLRHFRRIDGEGHVLKVKGHVITKAGQEVPSLQYQRRHRRQVEEHLEVVRREVDAPLTRLKITPLRGVDAMRQPCLQTERL